MSKATDIERIIEALLFSSSEPITLAKIKEIIAPDFPVTSKQLKEVITTLKANLAKEKRGFQLYEIAEGFILRTAQELFPYVEKLHQERKREHLSKAAMEVLAIVAFKQPVTRAEIEKIRTLDSAGTLASLVERGLIEVVGRLEVVGRPCQYGTTRAFLKHFGFKNPQELQALYSNGGAAAKLALQRAES